MIGTEASEMVSCCVRAPAFRSRGVRWIALLLAAAALGLLVHRFLVCFVIISGDSMAPNFAEGQPCLINRLTGSPARGDVVVLHDGEAEAIKRVVGLPNESICFQRGKVYVNGRELAEPYLSAQAKTYPVFQVRFTLGNSDYFVMGDNRGRSADSRVYGPIRRSAIHGRLSRSPAFGETRNFASVLDTAFDLVGLSSGAAEQSSF